MMSAVATTIPGRRLRGRVTWLVAACACTITLFLFSLATGARTVGGHDVMSALFHLDPTSMDQLVVRDLRLPRALLAPLAGAAFGAAGALIQAATRNPLADPGLLGVNAGAAFAMVLAVALLGQGSIETGIWFALIGAGLAAVLVHGLAAMGRDAATPIRLVLTGAALSAVLGGAGTAIMLTKPEAFDSLRMWAIGSVAGRDMAVVASTAPVILAGLAMALFVSRDLNAMSLGKALATGLGANPVRAQICVFGAVTLLAGAGTAAVGPIGFIGLVVPHMARWLVGADHRWIVALSIAWSAVLLLLADLAGRLLFAPQELPAGIVCAFIGAPVLVVLARHMRARSL